MMPVADPVRMKNRARMPFPVTESEMKIMGLKSILNAMLGHDPLEEQIKAILEASQRATELSLRQMAARNPAAIRNGCQVRVQVLPRDEDNG